MLEWIFVIAFVWVVWRIVRIDNSPHIDWDKYDGGDPYND